MVVMRQNVESYAAADPQTGRGGNLTELQQSFARWWHKAKPFQTGRREFTSMVLGFKGAKGGDGRVEPLSAANPIRPVHSIRFLSVTPIAARLFNEPSRMGHYRLNFMDRLGAVHDGEVRFGGPQSDYASAPGVSYQADAARRPLQDHQIYEQREYNPQLIGEQVRAASGRGSDGFDLTSPCFGTLNVVRDDLHFRITVEGHDIYRFALNDADAVEMTKQSRSVSPGDVVGRIHRRVTYLAADFTTNGRPVVDRIEGEIISATHRVPQLAFAIHSLWQMLEHGLRTPDDPQRPELIPMEAYFPIHLVQVPLHALRNLRASTWRPNVELQRRILHAVSPDALGEPIALHLRAPGDGKLVGVDNRCTYQVLSLAVEGGIVELAIPVEAQLWVPLGSTVAKGTIIGDMVPRGYYRSYDELDAVAGSALAKVEDAYLTAAAIHSGQRNWSGEGVLIDGRIAGVLAQSAIGHYFDTAPLTPHLDETYGIAMCPPTEFILDRGFQRNVHGVTYDVTPIGRKFAGVAKSPACRGRLHTQKCDTRPKLRAR